MPYMYTRIFRLRQDAKRGNDEDMNRLFTVMLQPPPLDKMATLDHGNDRYEYQFTPAPYQNDQVIHHLKLLIRELNRDSMLFAYMNFRVAPTTNAPPFWPPNSARPDADMKMYTFFDDFNEFPLTTWITLAPRSMGLRTESLHAKIGQNWVPVKGWLLSMQSSPDLLHGEKGYRAQRKWWKLNGKKFRLMDLPTELRLVVFEQCMGPRVYPLTTLTDPIRALEDAPANFEHAKVTWGFGNDCLAIAGRLNASWNNWGGAPVVHATADYAIPPPNLSLLSVSKQVRTEAQTAGWENTRKVFVSPEHLLTVIQTGIAPNHNWLNTIVLDFTMVGWYDFFGVKQDPVSGSWYMDSSTSLGYVIPSLQNLTTLQMWFSSPHDGYEANPYGRNGDYSYANEFVCCQRTMVDWIMTFAWPFVKDVPKVVVGGAAKKDSKVKWEYLLSLPAHTQEYAFDHLAEEMAIFDPYAQVLPPPCSYRKPCATHQASRSLNNSYWDGDDFDYEDENEDDKAGSEKENAATEQEADWHTLAPEAFAANNGW